MDKQLFLLLDASIALERNVSDLYMVFHSAFAEDADFWRQLAMEEERHVALLRSGKAHFAPVDKLPNQLLSTTLQEVTDANARVHALIEQYRECPPSRETALNTALGIEQSAGEIHFQEFMERQAESGPDRLFQQLNGYDRDHEIRIRSHMEAHAIEISECNIS